MTRISRFALALALAAGLAVTAAFAEPAGGEKTGFVDYVYKGPEAKDGESKYVVYVPRDYKGDKDYPCILFLHGGEGGSDGKKQVTVGLGTAIKAREAKGFPFITIFPQSNPKGWKADSDPGKLAMAILAEVRKNFKVDPNRIYLTGLSMGGGGTWSLAVTHPEVWAAIAPVCGSSYDTAEDMEKIKDIPCWAFHGDADKTVKVTVTRDLVAELKKAGANVKYTEYPGVGHNSWDKAYATDELYTWLLDQSKSKRKTAPSGTK
jgi:predicted peptidase